VAIQNRLKVRFRSAVQVELLFMIGAFQTRYKDSPVCEFQEFCS
jgi:hypothetical protein